MAEGIGKGPAAGRARGAGRAEGAAGRAERAAREALRERAGLARADYLSGRPVGEILSDRGVSRPAFYAWLDGDGLGLPPLRRRRVRPGAGRSRTDPFAHRRAAVDRLWRLASRGAGALAREAAAGADPDPRAVALAVRTLRELDRLDPAPAARDAARAALTVEDDDAERLREELARRLDRLVRDDAGRGPAAPDPGRDPGHGA